MEHLAPGQTPRHLDHASSPVEPHDVVAEGAEVRHVAAGAASEVEDAEGGSALDRAEECGVVLRYVVITSTFPERVGVRLVVGERARRDRGDLGRERSHADAGPTISTLPRFVLPTVV